VLELEEGTSSSFILARFLLFAPSSFDASLLLLLPWEGITLYT
jgi:hypothetical protein